MGELFLLCAPPRGEISRIAKDFVFCEIRLASAAFLCYHVGD